MLLLYNVNSVEAENGKTAICEINKYNYKVVFMDCNMPVMNGIEATRELREKIQFNNIILGLTGLFKDEMEGMIIAGANYVFTKPISKENIEKIVKYMKTNDCNIGTKLLDFTKNFVTIVEPSDMMEDGAMIGNAVTTAANDAASHTFPNYSLHR